MYHSYCFRCSLYRPHTLGQSRLFGFVVLLVGSFALLEAFVSHLSQSLALRADAGHLLGDTIAIAIALLATWSSRQTSQIMAARIEKGSALLNSLGLLGMGGLVGFEAIQHLQAPPQEILSLPMFLTATLGLVINAFNACCLYRASQTDFNLRGVFLHLLADSISSLGIMLAAIAIAWQKWLWADGLIGLIVASLIMWLAVTLGWDTFKQWQLDKQRIQAEQLLFPRLEAKIRRF